MALDGRIDFSEETGIMKVIERGDEDALRLIRASVKPEDCLYGVSDYAYFYNDGGSRLIKSFLSGMIVEATGEELAAIEHLKSTPEPFSFIEKNGLQPYIENRILKKTGTDECEVYLSLLRLLRAMRRPGGVTMYVVLVSTGCNARCTYCFEEGFIPRTMSKETADRLIALIEETHFKSGIILNWFGGEPLLGHSIITYVCSELEKRGVAFTSQITTNASLFDAEIADAAKEIWHLELAQVSLDGDRADYEAKKRYVNPKAHNFDKVMESIHLLADRGIKVTLRCNFDARSVDSVRRNLDFLKSEFGEMSGMKVDFAPLFQERDGEAGEKLFEEAAKLRGYARSIGVPVNDGGKGSAHLKLYHCISDNIPGARTIMPDGTIYGCEHILDGDERGDIWKGITNQELIKSLSDIEPAEECRRCVFLPFCTPFKKKGCAIAGKYCREALEIKVREAMKALAEAL